MATYEVGLLGQGGGDSHKVQVEATSPDKAKQAALVMAEARAQATNKPYKYHVTSVRQV